MKAILSKIDFFKLTVLFILITIAVGIWSIVDDISSIKYKISSNNSSGVNSILYDINSTLNDIVDYSSSIDSGIYSLEEKIDNVEDQLWSMENNGIRIKQ